MPIPTFNFVAVDDAISSIVDGGYVYDSRPWLWLCVTARHPHTGGTFTILYQSSNSDITFAVGEVGTKVTSVAGSLYDQAGHALTLATSGAGVVTSWVGSEYTVATGAIGSAASSAAADNDNDGAFGISVNPWQPSLALPPLWEVHYFDNLRTRYSNSASRPQCSCGAERVVRAFTSEHPNTLTAFSIRSFSTLH
ncbi:hypothetical protein BDZ89DRAFT_359538 [Hymenopellis radicata]|nr:hypothetical protein BDZ89DRAFT_359538 [Hymenopellis radicata]